MRLINGAPVSRGMALGRAYIYSLPGSEPVCGRCEAQDAPCELERFELAIKSARAELEGLSASLAADAADGRGIFAAHIELLSDDEMLDEVRDAVKNANESAEGAVWRVFGEFSELLASVKNELINARAADLLDVRERVLRILRGGELKSLAKLPENTIVVARDLMPSDTATIDREHILGIITELGGPTSHTAIIARGYGIPALTGAAGALEAFADGDEIALDALEGSAAAGFGGDYAARFESKRREYLERLAVETEFLDAPARLADGTPVQIGINIGSDAPDDGYSHCDFVGLFRTEFLYMQSETMPGEDEQYERYKRVLERAKGRPVTLRTLDIGGDKTLPYLKMPREENPFLGRRALRLCLDERELFKTQLRAALRSAAHGELWIMLPMVGAIEDIRKGREALNEARAELERRGERFGEVKLGIMIEIPSIAVVADLAARECDFASIGTNDLTQYLCAVDRMNDGVRGWYQSCSPAMLRVMGAAISAFNSAGKPISVCGELGGDPAAAVLLAGLGLRKLSMSSSNIARVKRSLSLVSAEGARELARAAMEMETEAEVLASANAALGI